MQCERFVFNNENEIRVIWTSKLLSITIDNYLSCFISENSENFVCTKSLKELEQILPSYFIRINRNVIINSNKIVKYTKKSREIILVNNTKYIVFR